MNKRIVNINGVNYLFVLDNKIVSAFKYKNGIPQIIDPHFATNTIMNQTIIETLNLIKDELKKEIIAKKYSKTDDYHNEFQKRLHDIEIPILKKFGKIDLTKRKEYKEVVKDLDETFKNILENMETKKDAIEKNVDVSLHKLFKENGITEYKINSSNSVITYLKDGIPHTINQVNPNTNIYETIIQNIEFDKMNNREEIDKSIKEAMEDQRRTFLHENDTMNISKAEYPVDQIADYLKENYHIKNIYGIKQTDKTINDGMLMVDFGKGFQPIFIKFDKTNQTKISFGQEKQIATSHAGAQTKVDIEDEKKQDDLNQNIEEYIDNKAINVGDKLQNGEDLTESEKRLLENDSNEISKTPSTKAKVKTLIMNKNQFAKAAFTNPLFLTFISGASFGLGIICIIETIFK